MKINSLEIDFFNEILSRINQRNITENEVRRILYDLNRTLLDNYLLSDS